MGRKATDFWFDRLQQDQSLTSWFLCMHWPHWLQILNGCFHGLCIVWFHVDFGFLPPKNRAPCFIINSKHNQGRPHKVQLDLPTKPRTIVGAQKIEHCDCLTSSHFTNTQGQGDKASEKRQLCLDYEGQGGAVVCLCLLVCLCVFLYQKKGW